MVWIIPDLFFFATPVLYNRYPSQTIQLSLSVFLSSEFFFLSPSFFFLFPWPPGFFPHFSLQCYGQLSPLHWATTVHSLSAECCRLFSSATSALLSHPMSSIPTALPHLSLMACSRKKVPPHYTYYPTTSFPSTAPTTTYVLYVG